MEMKVVAAPDRATLLHGGFDFCPGCGYGSVVLALAEIVDSLETREPPLFPCSTSAALISWLDIYRDRP